MSRVPILGFTSRALRLASLAVAGALFAAACGSDSEPAPIGLQQIPPLIGVEGTCVLPEGATSAAQDQTPFVTSIGCAADFRKMAAAPNDSTIPGALSAKVVLDRSNDALYFQNTSSYRVHWDFASRHLSGNGKPIVPSLATFNRTEYSSPDRRFILAAVTFYSDAKVWALELAPYDSASEDMIAKLHAAVAGAAYFGPDLLFHPTSDAVERRAAGLPPEVRVLTTAVLYAGIEYQPLNLAMSVGRLRFVRAADLATQYLAFRDIVVLDRVPNDVSVVMGIITEEFQTPLSHVNVLSQNRRTPNMGLRGAFGHARLRAFEGKWVRLQVGAFEYNIEEVGLAEADAWWEANRPPSIGVPRLDPTTIDLRDIERLVDVSQPSLREAVKMAIPAFGGKAAHYSALARVPGVPVPKAFAIPVAHYLQFMAQNGFDAWVDALLRDATFRGDPAARDRELAKLRADMERAPVDAGFQAALLAKLKADYPSTRMRFRSSTNAEDLEGFTGAGLYDSHSGQPGDPDRPVFGAIRKVWASAWFFRAFEEREYRGIDHKGVGMAVLVHRSFPDEEANGVALTANPFDTSGMEPAFYINVQKGEASVVQPDPGVTTDQFVYHFYSPGQPQVFVDRSSLVRRGQTVLTPAQTHELGKALDRIHEFFRPAYGADPNLFYAMDVEFKFDAPPGKTPALVVKQARPHPGRGR